MKFPVPLPVMTEETRKKLNESLSECRFIFIFYIGALTGIVFIHCNRWVGLLVHAAGMTIAMIISCVVATIETRDE